MAKYAMLQEQPYLVDDELEEFLNDRLEQTLRNFVIVDDDSAQDDDELMRL